MRTAIDQLDQMTTRLYIEGGSGLRSLKHRVMSDEEGQGTAEYVAVIVLIAAVITAVATNSGTIASSIRSAINAAFKNVQDTVTDA
ncbi:Flp family type IVb pilin [Nitriliruptor alkaliphilus]|uniref:Flp family type IVb pilin n=1 Tax=Nitriliruptor alkaliphilus TaxID=427918 RepID=UPI0006973216|nr:hypothetical protein [Nitriliruptor alkaliphilus]